MNMLAPDLQAGIAAARTGDHEQARACFIRLLKQEPRNETAWLWLSRVMSTLEESLRCIDHLLTLNPQHEPAREAKELLQIRLLLEESSVLRARPQTVSTPQRRYLLGEALVEARIITQQQLDKALREQAKIARKRPTRLGEILLHLKLVRPEQLEAAMAAQIESASEVLPQGSGQIGEYLIAQGLITRAQLHQGLARQAEWKRQGHSVLLGDVLVHCGYLKREQLNTALIEWQQQYDLAFH